MTKTTRDYQEGPKDTMLTTKYGRIRLHVNDAQQLYLDANTNSGSGPDPLFLTIRGVEYGASAHLVLVGEDVVREGEVVVKAGWRVSPGSYQRGTEKVANWNYRQGLYASRRHSFKLDDVSAAARRTMVEVFEEAANEWAARPEAKAALLAGEVASLSNDNHHDEEKLAELEEQVAQLKKSIRERDQRIAKLTKGQ